MIATTQPLDRAFLAEIESYLSTYGLKVTKARATSTESTGRADGCTPARVTASKHARCAAHWRVPGLNKPVCVAPERDEDGHEIGPAWSDADTVLAFAVEYARSPVDQLRAIAQREAEQRHAEHVEQARTFAERSEPDSLAGVTGNYVKRGPDPSAWAFVGSGECWACARAYGMPPVPDWAQRNHEIGAGDTRPSTYAAERARRFGVDAA